MPSKQQVIPQNEPRTVRVDRCYDATFGNLPFVPLFAMILSAVAVACCGPGPWAPNLLWTTTTCPGTVPSWAWAWGSSSSCSFTVPSCATVWPWPRRNVARTVAHQRRGLLLRRLRQSVHHLRSTLRSQQKTCRKVCQASWAVLGTTLLIGSYGGSWRPAPCPPPPPPPPTSF